MSRLPLFSPLFSKTSEANCVHQVYNSHTFCLIAVKFIVFRRVIKKIFVNKNMINSPSLAISFLIIICFRRKGHICQMKVKKTTFPKVVIILAKLQLCVMSSSTVYKMRGAQTLRNINHFIGGQNLFPAKNDIFAK